MVGVGSGARSVRRAPRHVLLAARISQDRAHRDPVPGRRGEHPQRPLHRPGHRRGDVEGRAGGRVHRWAGTRARLRRRHVHRSGARERPDGRGGERSDHRRGGRAPVSLRAGAVGGFRIHSRAQRQLRRHHRQCALREVRGVRPRTQSGRVFHPQRFPAQVGELDRSGWLRCRTDQPFHDGRDHSAGTAGHRRPRGASRGGTAAQQRLSTCRRHQRRHRRAGAAPPRTGRGDRPRHPGMGPDRRDAGALR